MAASPHKRTENFGIVSRPPTRECGSKGQVSSPKKNHAAAELRVIFGLMPAFFFINYCVVLTSFDSIFYQDSVRFGRRNVKKRSIE